MMNSAPTKVESVLLYQDHKIIDPQSMVQHLNISLGNGNRKFEIIQTGPNNEFAIISGGGLQVIISQTLEALELGLFDAALASPFVQLTFKNAVEILQRHKSHVFVTVKDDMSASGEPKTQQLQQGNGLAQSQAKFELKLTICQLMTCFIAKNSHSTAIHWLQSDMLLTPINYFTISSEPFPIPLFVHPRLFSSGQIQNGKNVVGMRTYGVSHLIGYEVIFIEAPVSVSWMFKRVCKFVSVVRENGALIEDGESFGATKNEIIRVQHRPPSDTCSAGLIELTLELSADVELDNPLVQQSFSEPNVPVKEEVMLDFNDPIDRAILNGLKNTGQEIRKASKIEKLDETADLHTDNSPFNSFGRRGSKLF